MNSSIQAGNILREAWPQRQSEHLNLYLGSGRCGACFDAFGLMHNGRGGQPRTSQSNTTLMHADHWHRGAFGLDYWLPIARLVWAEEAPSVPQNYRQELKIGAGRLRTEMAWPGLQLTFEATFHPQRRDLLAIEISYEAEGENAVPTLLLAPEVAVKTHYDQQLKGEAHSLELDAASQWWLGRVQMGTADSALALRVISEQGNAELKAHSQGVSLSFGGAQGRHLIIIGTAGMPRRDELCEEMRAIASPGDYMAEATAAWHKRWGNAFIQVPVPEYQAMWARSLYYTLCSYAPDKHSPAAPMGWAGNNWPFHFPQDVSYIHPALLRLGHTDIARSIVEFYRGYLEEMQSFTKRIYKVEGAQWAWEFPIGHGTRLLENGTPNWFQFEIHNAAYPARMARETSLHLRDAAWTREVAWPVVRESARFFGSVLQRENDGTWGMHVTPSMGQDELGGENAKNYLDALFSAEYCLKTALAMAKELGANEPAFAQWQRILADGLAYDRLLDKKEGIRASCEGLAGAQAFGKEKHPVQLNPLIFLPLGHADGAVRRAYERRYELCAGVREKFYHGWTLAAYWLAASHMGDGEGLLGELSQALPGRYIDPNWIQIYESSTAVHAAYYVTSHGLYLQALNDALVSDFWGETQIGYACPASWNEVSFTNLRTADGRVWSGHKTGDSWHTENAPLAK
jgi:hypothetical protein